MPHDNDSIASFHATHDHAAPASTPLRPAAGKVARTSGLRASGIPNIDRGPTCERADAEDRPGCWMTETQRTRLMITFGSLLDSAMDNFEFALQASRIDLLTATGPGWGWLEEVLCLTGGGLFVKLAAKGATKVLGRAAAHMAEQNWDDLALRVAKVDEGAVRGLAAMASRGVRSELKHRRTGLPTGNNGKAEFLMRVQRGVKPFKDAMVTSAAAILPDDDTLVAVALGYGDLSVHDTSVYMDTIGGWIADYDRNKLDDVGQVQSIGKRIGQDFGDVDVWLGQLAWVTHGDTRRLAMFKGERGDDFVRFVDDDWRSLALELYAARTGGKEPGERTISWPGSDDQTWADAFIGGMGVGAMAGRAVRP